MYKGTAPWAAEWDTHHLCQLPQQTRLKAPTAQRAFRGHCPGGGEARHPSMELWGTTRMHDHPADQQMKSGWHGHGLCSNTPQLASGAHRRMQVVGTCPTAGQGCHPPCSPQAGLRKPAVQRCAPQPVSLVQRRLGNV